MAAINNSKAVHHLYGTAHILKVEVMIQFQNNPSLNSFFTKVARTGEAKKMSMKKMSEKQVEEQVNFVTDVTFHSIFELEGGGAQVLHSRGAGGGTEGDEGGEISITP